MRKGKTRTFLGAFLLTALFFAGCQNDAVLPTNEDDIDKNISSQDTQENRQQQENQNISKKLGENEIISVSEPSLAILKDGKVWGELPVVGTEDAVYCNLPENFNGYMRTSMKKQVLVCPDPLYDITYYINYGNDFFIYALKNNIAELVVELPAKNLYCRGGKLYFIAESYERYNFDGLREGDILCYDPIDGKVSVIIKDIGTGTFISAEDGSPAKDETVPDEIPVTDTYMVVYQDGIYYFRNGEDIKTVYYYYSFEKEETKPLEITNQPFAFSFIRWKDDFFIYENGEFKLQNLKTQEKHPFKGEWAHSILCLTGDMAYTTLKGKEPGNYYSSTQTKSEIVIYNMQTEEKTHYLLDKDEDAYTSCMFLFNGTMYFSDLYLYSLSEEKGHYAYSSQQDLEERIGETVIAEYYTDGKQLYGLSLFDWKLYRIDKQEEPYLVSFFNLTYDYKFYLVPIGE